MAKKATDDDMILKLSRPYAFEEETIEELDFSGFDDISTKDMIEASDVLTRQGVWWLCLRWICSIASIWQHLQPASRMSSLIS